MSEEETNLAILRLHLLEQMGLVQVMRQRKDGRWLQLRFEGEPLWVGENAGITRFYVWRGGKWAEVTPSPPLRLVRRTIPIREL